MEENKKPCVALTDQERFPLLSNLTLLNNLRQDNYAPMFNFMSGDRLHKEHLIALDTYKKQIIHNNEIQGTIPLWIDDYIKDCIANVPFYKNRTSNLQNQTSITKDEIREQPWNFVHNNANIKELLVYQTSGTTGPPMNVNFATVTQASYIPQLESVLDSANIKFSYHPEKVAIALICDQLSTITYASLSTYLNGSGVLKINLNPSEWNNANDHIKYLEKYNPEVLTGDPFSFISLMKLKPNIAPKALVSSAMKLNDNVKEELSAYFNCPVFDVYSMTECRMIAFKEGSRYKCIRPDLYLEVLDPNSDTPLPNGEHGEIAITGGNNPFLHLIRYRTGDYGKIKQINGVQYIEDLEAREPILFYRKDKSIINNIDVSRLMAELPLAGYELHQKADYSLIFKGWSQTDITLKTKEQLNLLFGADMDCSVTILNTHEIKSNSKRTTYSSDLF